jgi:hypothetical protein
MLYLAPRAGLGVRPGMERPPVTQLLAMSRLGWHDQSKSVRALLVADDSFYSSIYSFSMSVPSRQCASATTRSALHRFWPYTKCFSAQGRWADSRQRAIVGAMSAKA